MTASHRNAAVAGQFYPNDSAALQSDINQYLNTVSKNSQPKKNAKAYIVPHAAYIYSGGIAASAYNQLKKCSHSISNVVLLGPAHRVAFNGIAYCSAKFFNTPLGSVPVNNSIIKEIKHLNFMLCNDAAHEHEHSLEVQLPFLQTVLKKFTIIPLLVGNCNSLEVSILLEQIWGDSETLILVSSDLSHFNTYQVAKEMDNSTSKAITSLQPEKINYENACGRTPVNGLLDIAKKKNLKVSILDVCNSGDTAGDKNRVVGYGSYSFTEVI
ncbi:COG1355, Predicted dioxygenase [hydrothermal vent metagenome]|uniref:COG1355, Predicted dioxygenase n=1 Tax=hydrothermal vent metagenome TaxID=652676 RepID=A0A3B0ZUX6_9ZZZZ